MKTAPFSPSAELSRPRLSVLPLVLYGVGNVGPALKGVLFGTYTLYLYTTVMGLSSAWVGAASAVCLLWDAFIDPAIGRWSDRSEHTFGRRHIFMLWGALTMGACFWAYMAPPRGLSGIGLFAWLVGASLLVRTAMSVFTVPYLALGAELSEDTHQRSSVTGVRGLVSLVGTATAMALSHLLFFPESTPGVDPRLEYSGYVWMGLSFGIAMSVLALTATLGTLRWRPRVTPIRPAPTVDRQGEALHSVLVSNASFRRIAASSTLFFVAVVLNKSVYLYFLTYCAGITDSRLVSLFEAVSVLGGVLGVLGGLWLLNRAEKVTLYWLATVGTAGILAATYFGIGEGRWLQTANLAVFVGILFLAGLFSSVVLFVPHSMLADIVDEDELVSGRRREGSFFGVWSLCLQSSTGIAILAAGILLQQFAGLVPGQAEQSAATVQRIGMIFSLIPAGLLMVAAVLVLGYPLSHQRVGEIQRILKKRKTSRAAAG